MEIRPVTGFVKHKKKLAVIMRAVNCWACETHSLDGVLVEFRKMYLKNITQVQAKGVGRLVQSV